MNKEPFDYIAWIRGSLDNSKDGASSKKMAAFFVVTFIVFPLLSTWTVWAFIKDNWDLLPEILSSLLIFAAAALSINGAEKIIEKFKKPTNEDTNNNTGAGAV